MNGLEISIDRVPRAHVTVSVCLASVVVFSLVATSAHASTTAWEAQSPHSQVQVVELYTSQGCSSCPPADRWLTNLGHKDPDFQKILPLAFHVTYWDALGWRDPYGQRKFAARQRDLAQAQDAAVYTPGVFLNGREWRNWRHRSVQNALPAGKPVGVLSFSGNANGHTTFLFEPHKVRVDALVLNTAFLLHQSSTEVKRGENRGQRLDESYIVQSHATFNMSCSIHCSVEAQLEPPAGAKLLAAWVTTRQGEHIQAAAGWL